jgi:hypothetical protein
MQAFAVVEANDLGSDIEVGLSPVGVFSLPHAYHFEVQKEAFGHGIVLAVPFAAHATYKTVTV